MDINTLLNELNVFSQIGSVSLVEDENRNNCGFDDVKDGDLMVYYDWMDDGLSEDDVKKFQEWYYDEFFTNLSTEMSKLGYSEVDEVCGSGGGLYYGVVLFRK